MAILNSVIQDMSNNLWGMYAQKEMSDLVGDSKWSGLALLGLNLGQQAIHKYAIPALTKPATPTPTTTKITSSALTSKNYGALVTQNWTSQINENNLKVGLLLSSSPDALTRLLGGLNVKKAINAGTSPVFDTNTADIKAYTKSNLAVLDAALKNGGMLTDQLTTEKTISSTSNTKGLTTLTAGAVGGQIAGMAAGYGMTALGNAVFGNSQGGLFATQALSLGASTIAGNIGSTVASNIANGVSAGSNVGSNLASIFSNAGSLTSVGAGVANIALDVFDPVKKAGWENAVNMGLGLASLIPGVGTAAAAAALAFNAVGHAAGQKSESFTADKELLGQSSGSYGGSINKIMTADALADTKYSLWNNSGRHKDDEKIFEAQRLLNNMRNIIGYNNDRRTIAQSNSGIMHTGRELSLAGGYNQAGVSVGKQGMTIQKRTVVSLTQPTEEFQQGGAINVIPTFIELTTEVEEFKEGGSLVKESTFIELVSPVEEFQQGGAINVIPDGALHARKHNMGIEGVTTKGIPVVSEKEGGEIEQQAEIEKEEIIFRLEVTKKLEELARDGSDKAAIEAGKLLVNEILYNTIDKTNNLL